MLVLAQETFPEIRETLRSDGFTEYEDFFDIAKMVPKETSNGLQKDLHMKCDICGNTVFQTYGSVEYRRCIECGSVERTRTLKRLLIENINTDLSNTKVLHISPMKSERILLKEKNAVVTTVDIWPECKVDIVADICNMPEIGGDSYDYTLLSFVLNAVYDDEAALKEIHRILKPKGKALIYVSDSGRTLKNTKNDDYTNWYGKEAYEKYKVGIFRRYGETDFTLQLRDIFSKVRCFEKYDVITDSSCKWYVCEK